MGIHQALIGGYSSSPVNWEVSNLVAWTPDNNNSYLVPSSNFAANDLIVFAFGDDTDTPGLTSSSITTTELVRGENNSIGVAIYYGVISDPPSNLSFEIDDNNTDYGVVMRFRRSGSTSSYNLSVEATNTTSNTPSHNNTSIAFDEDDLALLLAFLDDDFTTMGAPTGSTKISESSTSKGAVGAAYKQIDIDGNYSWGSWTTTDTDDTVAYVIKIQEV